MRQLFLGSKKFGINLLKLMNESSDDITVIHPNDQNDDRSVLKQFEAYCHENSINFYLVSTQEDTNDLIKSIKPDVVIVCGWYWIIPENILSLPRLGFFGIHNSLLPLFRGGSPLNWSIIDGGTHVGSSMFKFDKGMDSGDILFQAKIHLERNNNISDAIDKIEKSVIGQFPEKWASYIAGSTYLSKQDHNNATYCAQRIPQDGHIIWGSKEAHEIHDFVRAQSSPYPGAFTFIGSQKIIIEKTTELNERWKSTPGQVIKIIDKSVVLVGCKNDTVIQIDLIRTQEGIKNAADMINSFKIRLD